MKFLNLLMFILAFTIEVKVHATNIHETKVIETPQGCLNSQIYCILKNLNNKYSYKSEGFLISMAPESIIIRQRTKEFSFVKGQLFIKADATITFDVPYGQIEVDKESEVFLQKEQDRVTVQTVFGKVLLKPLGQKKPVLVLAGHENFVSRLDENLKAQTGIPKPIMIAPLLKSWAYHTDLKKNEFLERVESFKAIHQKAVRDLSILNEQIAKREIASNKAQKLARERQIRKAKEQKEKVQKTYYQRLLNLSHDE